MSDDRLLPNERIAKITRTAAARDVHYDVSSNFHPYECDGSGKCVHCDRRITYVGQATGRRPTPNTVRDWEIEHDPATCALCDPEYDMQPNPLWARAEGDNQ